MNDNKLIAEFMGVDIITLEQFLVGVQSTIAQIKIGRKDYICPMTEGYLLEHLQYHTSWDWLMPVAKKCINPEDNTEGWDNLAVALTTCNIEKVYQAVVEFIKEYNSERSKWNEQTRIEEGLDHKG
jgi:hypothetical protein